MTTTAAERATKCGEYGTWIDVLAIVGRLARQDGWRLDIIGEPGEELYGLIRDAERATP